MLKLKVVLSESFNDATQEFVTKDFVLELEHSLVSLSKWESEFEKPFLVPGDKTNEEILGYVRAMILNTDYPSDILEKLSQDNVEAINNYIDKKMTATTVNEIKKNTPSREKITSELVYYWMVSYQIPWEAQYWHLNRLFMLIRIFNAKNESSGNAKKRSPGEIAAERREINERRLKEFNTSG